jgi:PKD repeat protein
MTVTVTDDDGVAVSESVFKTVSNRPPIVSLAGNASTVATGQLVHFDASESHDLDGTIVSFLWDFGDGTTATAIQDINHAYSKEGTYTVTLNLTDDDGASSWTSVNITVKPSPELFLDPPIIVAISLGIAASAGILIFALRKRRSQAG